MDKYHFLGTGQLLIILLSMTNCLPMIVSHTLCQLLQVLLILTPVNELLHQLNSPLCPIIYCQELSDKVFGLNLGRNTWPWEGWKEGKTWLTEMKKDSSQHNSFQLHLSRKHNQHILSRSRQVENQAVFQVWNKMLKYLALKSQKEQRQAAGAQLGMISHHRE